MQDEVNEIPASTPNFRSELAEKLAEMVPEAIADGKIDTKKLEELLDGDASDTRERFGLFWPGKKRALRAAQEPTTATLFPDKENSRDWDTTENVFIEGDNLEVLKILQKHYHGKIKMIYIDPPYNTGKDFVYPDNYKEGLKSYLKFTQQVDESGKPLNKNTEQNGRYHSNWLNMMYPRLKLARNLLTKDGAIFISIDDHEVSHLRKVCDEVFGELNFVENYFWESNFRPDNSSRVERENAQHILCYARDRRALKGLYGAQKATEGLPSLTKSSMNPTTLKFQPQWVDISVKDGHYPAGKRSSGYTLESEVVIKDGVAQNPIVLTGRMIWSQGYLEQQISQGTRIVIKGDGFVPYSKKLETAELAPTTLIPKNEAGDVLAGNAEMKALFGSVLFNHPKPTSLLKYLIRSLTKDDPDALVLDFFAGSASTAHATMALNADDGGNRRFMMVQLPEPLSTSDDAYKEGYLTIAELSRMRIRLAGQRIAKDEKAEFSERATALDVGFRAYKLTDTNFVKWRLTSDISENELEQQLLNLRESANDEASQDALLTELLLKRGYSLVEQVDELDIAGLDIYGVKDAEGDYGILVYLNEHVKPSLEQLRELVEASEAQIIILEDAFQGDDQLKTNLAQLCKSNHVELWTA